MIKDKVRKILNKAAGKKICIVGDVMLDRYMLGNVSRISPEAPVQVFEINKNEHKLGGAANVSLNLKTLGAEPVLIGVIGDDAEGVILKDVMIKQGQTTEGLIKIKGRPTTCKTRVIADSHHLIRIDSESKIDISSGVEKKILDNLRKLSDDIEIIILQDYNKGVLTLPLIKKIVEFSAKSNKKVLVDPKFDNFFEFKNVYLFKPNRKELHDALGRKTKDEKELIIIFNQLMERINCLNLVITLGENGMKLICKTGAGIKLHSIKTRARKVADVSGAGDTVISTIAVCLSGAADIFDAVEISNIAAGLVVEEVGIVPIEKNNLIKHIESNNI